MADLMAVEAGAELVFYAATRGSPFREAPQLVRQVTVLRTTKTQVIIKSPMPRADGEMRFRKDDGYLVGGGYGSERLQPLTVDSMRDVAESATRRRVHNIMEKLETASNKLYNLRAANLPIAKVQELEPLLVQISLQLGHIEVTIKGVTNGS
jgi:hypothetical protein